jgi:hypothetical protein
MDFVEYLRFSALNSGDLFCELNFASFGIPEEELSDF